MAPSNDDGRSMLARLRAGELAGTTRLALNAGLDEFPREIFGLADSLEVLDLSGNALETLPSDLGRLHRLRVLFCSGNRFTRLPEAIGSCRALDLVGFKSNRIEAVPGDALPPSLRWLILTDNRIEALPREIGRLPRLQKLMLAGNRLAALPDELAACENLALIRIAANRLGALPPWLVRLPRLSWLAFAGNTPGGGTARSFDAGPGVGQRTPAVAVPWHALALEGVLGEGASGVIHRARWTSTGAALRPVAVKLFKGAVTSDGWPHDEMDACIAAGAHPGLVPILGRIEGHPEGRDGLVLALVAPRFRNLAGPPSLASCTRDVYPDAAAWPPEAVRRIAGGVASAVAHLHRRGILHGDLYAHNLLCDDAGQALLGDFGAASPLPGDPALSAALVRLEARAFGCLLEELLARCVPAGTLPRLTALAARCLDLDVGARPHFDEIAAELERD